MSGALRWVSERFLIGLAALVTVLVALVAASPVLSDPVLAVVGPDASAEQTAAVRDRLGLDEPPLTRVVELSGRVLVGDFGESYRLGLPARELVVDALPRTVSLALVAAPIGVLLGVVGGLGLGLLRRRAALAGGLALLAVQAVPGFVVAIVAVQLFAVRARVVPPSGPGTLWLAGPLLGIGLAVRLTLLLGDRLTVLTREPFVATALGHGLSRSAVALRHLLRPAASVVVSYAAVQFGYLLGGSVVVQTVFGYPGLGRLAVQALGTADLPVVLAAAAVAGTAFLGLRIAADVALVLLDPRVRSGTAAAARRAAA